ncbi:DUF1456 family protein [Oceanobacillus bengalensis]|uniref:DUF1456 family protein n=1 Tax=Oceanobacillus bengalensis TaxID=1435466 RepID=A0A494Z3M6_9BACI|nr:DUF1456 family protein [Oceanobacillus bengalensis]RKQ17128.1 DUF1456 family protein [Oceanobacillus bengalensis]
MSLSNNDILVRLRFALNIKDSEMVKIFKLGGIELTIDEVRKMLVTTKEIEESEYDDYITVNNLKLESFLNGFITHKRGKQETKSGQADKPLMSINSNGSVNNVLLKKLKIALTLTSEDMIDILKEAGVTITKGEMSALLRKEGHKNYKECGDKFARNFLRGLALKYRG